MLVGWLFLQVAAGSQHIKDNGLAFRYGLPVFVLMLTAATLLSGLAVVHLKPWKRHLATLAWVGVIVVGFGLRYGGPSFRGVHEAIDARFGQPTSELLASGATLVLGQYFEVWEAVFHANLTLYEKGEARRLYGLAHRGDVYPAAVGTAGRRTTASRYRRTAESAADLAPQSRHFGLPPLERIEQTPFWDIYRPMATDPQG